jgi:hypothetical protein
MICPFSMPHVDYINIEVTDDAPICNTKGVFGTAPFPFLQFRSSST